MTDKEQELKTQIEEKLRANIIREIKVKYPKGFCYACGNKSVTIHHLREHIIGRKKRKGKCNGEIPLCRKCHDFVEAINIKIKLHKTIKEAELKGIQSQKEKEQEFVDKVKGKIKGYQKAYYREDQPIIKDIDKLSKEVLGLE